MGAADERQWFGGSGRQREAQDGGGQHGMAVGGTGWWLAAGGSPLGLESCKLRRRLARGRFAAICRNLLPKHRIFLLITTGFTGLTLAPPSIFG